MKGRKYKMESIWSKTIELPEHPALTDDIQADVAVIGGGLAGILTAYSLKTRGVDVVVLEASRIGSGQTRNTTAKITSQHNLIYKKLINDFGKDTAKLYAEANEKAIREYKRIIEKHQIGCDFEQLPAYLYSITETDVLEDEAEAAKSLGIDAEFQTETELPVPIKGALKFNNQAQFHPMKFLVSIAEGLKIYENTRVVSVKDQVAVCEKGSVTASHIVFATHYPFLNFPGYYFMRMHQERSYLLALENVVKLNGMYLSIDKEDGYSFRNYGNILLFGGSEHRTGENKEGGKYDSLKQAAAKIFRESNVIANWSAQDCVTIDGLPYIGRYSAETPNYYVATGFKKWGMTTSMVSAMILSDMITGRENPYESVFTPQRFHLSPSAKSIAEDSLKAVKGLVKQIFSLPSDKIKDIEPGNGGIIDYNDEKVGVYKDTDGEIYTVSTRCPHLGCQLEWNPDEKSWDCPCHGSRFDYKGEILDNPAQENINHGTNKEKN